MSAPSRSQPPHAVWLVLPEVTRAIEGTLSRAGLRGADLEDHRQIVLERALVVAEPPGGLGECIALVQRIARDAVVDALRRKRRRSKLDAGPCDDADERPAADRGDAVDRIDERRQLEFVRGVLESPAISSRQATILEHVAAELPQPEIAAQMNLAHSTVRNELAEARRRVRSSWALFAAAAFVIVGIMLFQHEPDEVGSPPPEPPPSATPHEPTPPASLDLRRSALAACDRQEWITCLRDLDAARRLDPEGDYAPAIQTAREDAKRALDESRRGPGGMP
jgi:DNA-directed RNA polymerase specialized sigma24 family protein